MSWDSDTLQYPLFDFREISLKSSRSNNIQSGTAFDLKKFEKYNMF